MQGRIERLQKKLNVYDIDIARDPNNPTPYSQKAGILVKFGDVAKDASYYDMAYECYSKAIELSKHENPLYLAERSMLHARLGHDDLAIDDVITALKLPRGDGTIANHAKYTLQSVIEKVKGRIELLRDNGRIGEDLAKSLLGFADDFVSMAHHPRSLIPYDAVKIELLLERVMALECGHAVLEEENTERIREIAGLRQKFVDMEESLGLLGELYAKVDALSKHNEHKEHKGDRGDIFEKIELIEDSVKSIFSMMYNYDGKIKSLTEDMSDLLEEDELNTDRFIELYGKCQNIEQELREQNFMEISKRLATIELTLAGLNQEEGVESRIAALENEHGVLIKRLDEVVQTLKVTGVFEEAEIKGQIEDLCIRDEQLYKYFTLLYFELEAYLQVYKELGTGLLHGRRVEDLQQSVLGNIKSVLSVFGKAGWEIVTGILDEFGVMSALYGIVDDVRKSKEGSEVLNQVNKIHRVVQAKLLDDGELNKNEIARISLNMARIREAQLLEEEEKAEEPVSNLERLDAAIGDLGERFLKVLDRYHDASGRLAAHDALLLIGYICNRWQKLESSEIALSAFFNEWSVRELEVSARMQDSLKKVEASAAKGHWKISKRLHHKHIEGRLTAEYIEEKLGSLYCEQNAVMTKMLYFAMINVGIMNSKHPDLECLIQFKGVEPELFDLIAREHPEYFAGHKDAINLIDDIALKFEMARELQGQVMMDHEVSGDY